MTRRTVTLLGAGDLALALGLRLARADWPLAGVADPDHSRALEATLFLGCPAYPRPFEPVARSGILLLMAPDLWPTVAASVGEQTLVAHTCPDHPAGAEKPLALRLLRFLPPADRGETTLTGAPVALEGPADALAEGTRLVEAMGLQPVPIDRPRLLIALAAWHLQDEALWRSAGLEGGPPAGVPTGGCEGEREWLSRLVPPEVAARLEESA